MTTENRGLPAQAKTSGSPRLGLVLSGGGSKGAYEVGMMKTLAAMEIRPGVIAAASIGALNGAALASAPDIETGAALCEQIWTVEDIDPKVNPALTPANIISGGRWRRLLQRIEKIQEAFWFRDLGHAFSPEKKEDWSLFDQSAVRSLMKDCIDFEYLLSQNSPEFYVSVFPGNNGVMGLLLDLGRYGLSQGRSKFFRLKDFGQEEAINILLASAALPIGFRSVKIGGQTYRDGGMGDRLTCQGNAPAEPLAKSGCSHAIVCLLDQAALWNRYEWPSLTTVEIRPSRDIGGKMEMMDFNPERIQDLIQLGQQDADRTLGKVFSALSTVQKMKESRISMEKAVDSLDEGKDEYEDVMRRFKK